MRTTKDQAAWLCGHGGLSEGSGEAFSVPQAHSSTFFAERQEAICRRLASDHRRAQVLAAHHLSLAERFVAEAEALGDLLRQAEVIQ